MTEKKEAPLAKLRRLVKEGEAAQAWALAMQLGGETHRRIGWTYLLHPTDFAVANSESGDYFLFDVGKESFALVPPGPVPSYVEADGMSVKKVPLEDGAREKFEHEKDENEENGT